VSGDGCRWGDYKITATFVGWATRHWLPACSVSDTESTVSILYRVVNTNAVALTLYVVKYFNWFRGYIALGTVNIFYISRKGSM
jgi:hypothetical protein